MRRLRIARTSSEIEALRPVWQRLHRPEQTLFQTFHWNCLAARAFSDREAPFVVFVEDDNGAALVPGCVAWHEAELRLLGETLFDYRDVLQTGDPQALNSALAPLAQLDKSLNVTGVMNPEAEPWASFEMQPFAASPQLRARGLTAEEFEHQHSRLASRLRRLLRREGVELKLRSGADSHFVRALYDAKGRQPNGELFRDKVRVKFLVEACRIEGPNCEIFSFEKQGTVYAALVTFREEHVRRFYTTYFDVRWASYSPGMLLLYAVCRRSLQQHLDFDFMTGEQPYKLRIANHSQPLFRATATAAMLRSRTYLPLQHPATAGNVIAA